MMTSTARLQSRDGCDTIAVTGAKGGVGKSNLAVNLAVALGRMDRKVLLVDGDLGLANLDVLLGLVPTRTVEHLVRGEATMDELLLDGPAGVKVLPAASGVPELARLDEGTRRILLSALGGGEMRDQTVVVDTGAGIGEATRALQLAASRVLVVTTPEPTSLVDAYASLKVLWTADPDKPVDLVLNLVEDEDEARGAFEQISRATSHFLGCKPGLLGSVVRDPKVSEAVRRQKPVLELHPSCPASRCYERIALSLMSMPVLPDAPDGYWDRLLDSADREVPN